MTEDSDDIRLEIHIKASTETVFALLTDPEHMKIWFAEIVEADPRPGGIFRLTSPAGATIEGTYLEVVTNRKVVFTWGGVEGLMPGQSIVEIRLEPHDGGTLLLLRHSKLPPDAIEVHRQTWAGSGLGKIKDAAEGRPPARTSLTECVESRAGS